jgi:hypothetical protein
MATPTSLPSTFTSGQVLTASQMNNLRGAFRVLQVVSTTKTDTFTSGSVAQGADTDVTGLSVTITPSATSSLILVYADVTGIAAVSGNRSFFGINIYRGATQITRGDAAGSRTRASRISGDESVSVALQGCHAVVLDNPATTSATTYKVAAVNALTVAAAATIYVNRTITDTDSSAWPRTASSITVMEISA